MSRIFFKIIQEEEKWVNIDEYDQPELIIIEAW